MGQILSVGTGDGKHTGRQECGGGGGRESVAHAPEVGGLETGRSSLADVEGILKMLVQGV